MTDPIATRAPGRLLPDPSRVVAQLFVPGHFDHPGGFGGRASGVIEHILSLDDAEVTRNLAAIEARFGRRHRNLDAAFARHADRLRNRLTPGTVLSHERSLLLGATFTQEYAVEAAAACNPSLVRHPDQTNVPRDALRVVMSVRQIGEGHRSCVGFLTGVLDATGALTFDERAPYTTPGTIGVGALDADAFRRTVRSLHGDADGVAWVLDGLPDRFTIAELAARLSELETQHDTRGDVVGTAARLLELAARNYTVDFPRETELAERVLAPATRVESNGMEDARFVRFVDDDASVAYHATYTAYDGRDVAQQRLTTTDFATFTSSPLVGAAAANKGMALFPRRVGGRFAALTRHDGCNNALAFSDDLGYWPTAVPLAASTEPWETVQVGNCGSPIETDEGWLVLTHGVGPMRTYSIGAMLLDLDVPTRILGRLRQPLLAPLPKEQNGYVPNVVYSCGALLHGATLVVPYGVGDREIALATVSLRDLLHAMERNHS